MLAVALMLAPGCLVLSVNPLYDDDTLTWDPALIGSWTADEERWTLQIERDEWRSYDIRYTHPAESGHLTGYLTAVGEEKFLDVMPSRGRDRGALLVPAHAFVHVRLDGDRLHVTPVAYDTLADRLLRGRAPDGLDATFDQKENVLLTTPTPRLRAWLRRQAPGSEVFGVTISFSRVREIPAVH